MKIICTLFILALVAPRTSAQDLSELHEKAYQYFENGDHAKAAKVFDKMIKAQPDSAYLHTMKGVCHCEEGKAEASFEAFSRSYELDPEDWRFYDKRAECYRVLGMKDKAVQDLSAGLKLVEVDSLRSYFYLNRGSIKNSYRDIHGALSDNEKALALDSMNIAIHNNIAMSYGKLEQFDKAEYHLRRAIAIDSTFEGGWLNLGFLFLSMERLEEALDVLTLAVTKFPDSGVPYNNRGMVRHKLGDSKGAIEDIEQSLELFSGNSYAYRNLALIYKDMNAPRKACENCTRAIQMGYTERYDSDMKKLYKEVCTQ